MSIEHSAAFRSLAENRMFASSFVVLRAQFETTLRAVWALYAATDNHISRISARLAEDTEQAAKNLPQVQDMLAAIAGIPNAKVPHDALSEFKGSAWRALNSYTHGGIHPLSRMADGYPLELIFANVKISNALAIVAAMQFCVLTGINGLQKQLIPLNERFHDCLPAHRVGA
ncbi:hypothetical protein OS187_12980 [Xanthomonadaceae bacterium JHOS43]|nr:hypothetical protein [Xanthomonadaceae bacterium JHOS43]